MGSIWRKGRKATRPDFQTPDELWARTFAKPNLWRDRFAAVPYEDRGGSFQGRYYQETAVDRVMEAIATDRVLRSAPFW